MKKLLLFNLLLFSGLFNTFTMKQPQKETSSKQEDVQTQPTLPTEIWYRIVKEYGVDKKALTEKEIFKNMDNLRLTSKDIKFAIDVLVDKVKKSKNKPIYSYVDFKNDIMQDILVERAKKIVPLRPTSKNQFEKYKEEIINQASKSEAINWSKHRLSIDSNYQENLNLALLNSLSRPTNNLEQLLIFGANPNSFDLSGKPILELAINHYGIIYDTYKFTEILLKYGANPNIEPNIAHNPKNMIQRMIQRIDLLKTNPAKIIELLLKYRVEISTDDLKYAKNKLKTYEILVQHLPINIRESYQRAIPELKEIIKLLEKALKKQGVYKTII